VEAARLYNILLLIYICMQHFTLDDIDRLGCKGERASSGRAAIK
jgi:hypothetical protein